MTNETYDTTSAQRGSRSAYYIPVLALALLIVAGGAWYFYQTRIVSDTVLKEQFQWTFAPTTTGAEGSRLQTGVSLKIAGVDVPVGTFVGNCSAIDGTTWKLLEGEVAGAICQNGEVGVEIGVFNENGSLVLKRGEVAGSDPATAERTDFAPIVSPS